MTVEPAPKRTSRAAATRAQGIKRFNAAVCAFPCMMASSLMPALFAAGLFFVLRLLSIFDARRLLVHGPISNASDGWGIDLWAEA